MIYKSASSSLVNALQARVDSTHKRNTAAIRNPLQENILNRLKDADPEKAEELSKELEDAQRVSNLINQAIESHEENKKAAARQELERIKKELEMLRFLAAGDPEGAARRAQQLGKKLKQAVAQFASAASGNTPTIGTPTANAQSIDTQNAQAQASQGQQSANSAETAAAKAEQQATASTPTENADTNTNALKQEIQQEVAKNQQKFAEHKENTDFARDARTIARNLESIIEQAKKRLREDEKREAKRDFEEIDTNLSKIENAAFTPTSTTPVVNLSF